MWLRSSQRRISCLDRSIDERRRAAPRRELRPHRGQRSGDSRKHGGTPMNSPAHRDESGITLSADARARIDSEIANYPPGKKRSAGMAALGDAPVVLVNNKRMECEMHADKLDALLDELTTSAATAK